MANRVIATPFFEKRFKKLAKIFPSLSNELNDLGNKLIKNPELGTSLGNGLFKIRLASKSKNTGKSGGFRVITYLITETDESVDINLIIIYDKSEISDIPKEELLKIVNEIFS